MKKVRFAMHGTTTLNPMATKQSSSHSNSNAHSRFMIGIVIASLIGLAMTAGCNKTPDSTSSGGGTNLESASETSPSVATERSVDQDSAFVPATYSASAEELLAARLSPEEAANGWVRLFDGHTLFGWEITGRANFRVEDGAIVVDEGAQCLMCTSSTWGDFELSFEFKSQAATNSGVFVRIYRSFCRLSKDLVLLHNGRIFDLMLPHPKTLISHRTPKIVGDER